jgi:hypothetical protein
MKRNYDLIREILIAVEQHPEDGCAITLKTRQFFEQFPKLTDDEMNTHIQMLVEEKFLVAEPHQFGWFITQITWKGHDLIEQSRVPTVWEKAKHVAGHLALGAFASVLNDAAVSYAKSLL